MCFTVQQFMYNSIQSFNQSRLSTTDYALLVIISSDILQESRHLNGRINDRRQA
jgi:hypothetical protein